MGHLGVVQGVALVSGSFLSGAMMSLCFITMPVLVNSSLSSAQLTSVWAQIYIRGRGLLPALAVITFAIYGYVYIRQQRSRSSRILLFAGAMTIAIAPFTWIVLAPTNNKLFALKAENQTIAGTLGGAEPVKQLINEWTRLHFMRSLLPLFGAATGLLYEASR